MKNMKITKYDHACFSIEHEGSILLVDPGNDAIDAPLDGQVDIVYFTHEHDDHCSAANLEQIIKSNPHVTILGSEAIATKLSDFKVQIVSSGELLDIDPFRLRFCGDTHATIYPTLPTIQNVGILINDRIYYPGDSFEPCPVQPEVLLLPIAGPWLRIQDAIDLMINLRPSYVLPTHYSPLSDIGKGYALRWVKHFASEQQIKLCDVGQSLELGDSI